MQYTVLQLTQNILSALNSDQVNSIGDNAESYQVATILQQVFYNMASRSDLPEQYGLFQLVPSNNPLIPVQLSKPNNVSKVHWIKYFDTNPFDGGTLQTDQFGAYSHDLNVDLQNNASFQQPSGWSTTSTTSITVGLGSQTFSVPTQGIKIGLGDQVEILSGTTLYMSGVVTAYYTNVSSSTGFANLVINVTAINGAGTFSTWTITQLNAIGQAPGYCYIRILPIAPFIDMVNKFNMSDQDVFQYQFSAAFVPGNTPQNFTFYYKNDHQPSYCTCVENDFFLFDTFDSTQDSTLQASKTMCYGELIPQFLLQDNFIPDLNDYQFPLLIAEAKELAFLELKQMDHPKAAQESRRQWSRLQKDKSVTNKPSYFNQLPNFGRMPNTGGYGQWGYGSPGQGPGGTWDTYSQ